jgi:hypothetical protein
MSIAGRVDTRRFLGCRGFASGVGGTANAAGRQRGAS